MGAQAEMQADSYLKLRAILENTSRDHGFLRDYVRELELQRNEEDIFLRLAFQDLNLGGPYDRGGIFVLSGSELYEPLGPAERIAVRKWWHDKTKCEAAQFEDLRDRISKLSE